MTDPGRPDPDALLAAVMQQEAQVKLGRLHIFLGMCPGVGKTYAMLQAARQRRKDGVDVLAGIVETHGRNETSTLLEGFEILPRKPLPYRDHQVHEFDVDAVLQRKPALVLVDELAHTNAPGSRHAKRYQDVLELIGAGIDVYTTLNVQHIESQVDIVRQITGITIQETVPDSILDHAFEIELIDLSVDKLLERMAAGKVYLGERAEHALSNFFKEGNLTALREMALRFTAERVDRDLENIRRARSVKAPWKTNARLMVGVGPSPYAESLIRWTRRAAARLGCSWLAVWVEGARELTAGEQDRLTRSLGLARQLGAEVVSATGDDVAQALMQVARERNVTQIAVGKPGRTRWWRSSLADRIIRESGDIDVCVVRPTVLHRTNGGVVKPSRGRPQTSTLAEYGWTLGITVGVLLLGWMLLPYTGYVFGGLLLLLAITMAALLFRRGPVLLMAALGALLWNVFFIPPYFTLHIHELHDALMFGLFFIVALSMGHLTSRLRQREKAERQRQRQTAALLRVTQSAALSAESDQGLTEALQTINELLQADTALVIRAGDHTLIPAAHRASTFEPSAKEWGVIHWCYNNKQAAGRFTDTLPLAEATWFPLRTAMNTLGVLGVKRRQDSTLDFSTRQAIEAFALQLALVLEKDHFLAAIKYAELLAQSEKLQRTLLDSVSHELKTPLAVIQSSLEAMGEAQNPYLGEIHTASQRLQRVVNHLLQMTRLEAGAVQPVKEWCLPGDLIHQAVEMAPEITHQHELVQQVPEDLPAIQVDANLLSQALANLLHNASVYTPAQTAVEIHASVNQAVSPAQFIVKISDRGPGLPDEALEKIFTKFYRIPGSPTGGTGLGLSIARSLVRALGGDIQAANRKGGGAEFTIQVPVSVLDP